ncbi:MAG TPA: hypothetical protein VL501_06475 [Pyrinomonadaceae bacterium]|nr:hypothetical protein [Pyrinomonadaceae bacterium]
MKEILSTVLLITTFALFVPAMPVTALVAVPLNEPSIEYSDFLDYGACPRGTYRVRKHTRTKKKVVNSVLAGGAGAVVGGLVGGGKGAVIGAGVGAGSYLTYRYVKDRHGRCVRRYA